MATTVAAAAAAVAVADLEVEVQVGDHEEIFDFCNDDDALRNDGVVQNIWAN